MQITMECEQFIVFDDVLAPDELAQVWTHVQSLQFTAVKLGGPGSPWLSTDGHPMSGPAVAAWADPEREIADSKLTPFPTGAPVDILVERLLDLGPQLVPWTGPAIDEWIVMTAIPWLYPAGSALSWHTDSTTYSGAFAFYIHPVWDPRWGGELVFAHPSARIERELVLEPNGDSGLENAQHLDRQEIADRIAERGIGHAVMPRPNRLVVTAGGHPHKIVRVDPAAAQHVRASYAGFFVRTQALATLVRAHTAHATPR